MSLAIQVHYRTKINLCVLIAKNSIKGIILKMQEKKAALAGEILASEDGMAFSREELAVVLVLSIPTTA